MGRSQRHKVYIQGVAADGKWRAEGVVGNAPVAGADGGPLQGSTVPGPTAVTVEALQLLLESGWTPGGGVPNEAPVASGLSPDTAVAGDPTDITMTVNGSGFTEESVIVFNTHDEPTNFISESAVSTIVKPSIFIVSAVCPVEVRNADGQVSNAVDFTFTDPVD